MMNILNKKTLATLAVLAVSACPLANVQAAACDLENGSSFTLEAGSGSTGTISCYAAGEANIHFQNNDVVISGPDSSNAPLFANVTDLTSSISVLENKASGAFEIESSVWDNWDSIYIGLKQSQGYGLFLLTESILSGTWSAFPVQGNGLVRYLAFGGDAATPDVPEVPVPAALWLFGSGLVGLMGTARSKSAAAQA